MPYFRQVATMHHERVDGGGYPYGKKGDEIPFMAKVCAIADAYDGMSIILRFATWMRAWMSW